MNKSLLAAILLASAVAPVAAQEATVPIDVFLEQRVAEELAADGTILSRLGVALDVEAVGDKLIVSLVDPATRRAVASTKVDTVPADREAAVAAVTQVAANLAAQLGRTAQPAAAQAVKQVLDEQREDRAAEYRYRQEAISFGSEIAVWTNGKTTSVGSITVAYQGDMHRKLHPQEFYQLVGRPDLADAYDRRVTVGWTGLLAGGAVSLVGMYLWVDNAFVYSDACDIGSGSYDQCQADYAKEREPYKWAGIGLTVGGTVGMLVGYYYLLHRNPVDESEVYSLAAQHNEQLRAKYGLPTTSLRKPRKIDHSFVIAPYAGGDGGGLAVAGRF
jgi:hypothetical protein